MTNPSGKSDSHTGFYPAKSRPPKPGRYFRLWPNGFQAESYWTGCEWCSSLSGRSGFRSPFQSLPWKEIK